MTTLFIIVACWFLWKLFNGFKVEAQNVTPNDPHYSVYEVKQLLGFDFGSDYTILKHESNPSHGDRPVTIILKFPEDAFAEIMSFVRQLKLVETVTQDQKKGIKYWEAWQKTDQGYQKSYSATHRNGGYTFFRASLSIDPINYTINHHESGY